MKLSDVMSSMQLAAYAEVGLVLFLGAFIAIAIQLLVRGRALESLASLPLEPSDLETPTEQGQSR